MTGYPHQPGIDNYSNVADYLPDQAHEMLKQGWDLLPEDIKKRLSLYHLDTITKPFRNRISEIEARIATLTAENEALKLRNRWIPVSERLPKRYEEVYIYPTQEDYGEHHVGEMMSEDGVFQYFVYEPGEGYVGYKTTKITHWMPLPPPPREQD